MWSPTLVGRAFITSVNVEILLPKTFLPLSERILSLIKYDLTEKISSHDNCSYNLLLLSNQRARGCKHGVCDESIPSANHTSNIRQLPGITRHVLFIVLCLQQASKQSFSNLIYLWEGRIVLDKCLD